MACKISKAELLGNIRELWQQRFCIGLLGFGSGSRKARNRSPKSDFVCSCHASSPFKVSKTWWPFDYIPIIVIGVIVHGGLYHSDVGA